MWDEISSEDTVILLVFRELLSAQVHLGVKLGCKGKKRSAINWRKTWIQPR